MSIDALVVQKIGCAVEFNCKNPDYFLINPIETPKKEGTLITLVYFKGKHEYCQGNARYASAFRFINSVGEYSLGVLYDYNNSGILVDIGIHRDKYIAIDTDKMIAVTLRYKFGEIYECLINGSKYTYSVPYTGFDVSKTVNIGIGASYEVNSIKYYCLNGYIYLILWYNRLVENVNELLSNYPNILTKDLVLWLDPRTYDESAGKWYDLSGKDNHATAYGNPTKVSLKRAEVIVK